MSSDLAQIAELVRRETGIVLAAARETAILGALRRAAPGLDPAHFVRATSEPLRGRGLLDRLIDEVTVQETYFLRDAGQLEPIAWHSLLTGARAAGSGTIRVWSAGCASGEEAYTLALLAAEAFAPQQAPVEVLGTDISGAALAAAVAGRYSERAVRAMAAPLRARYLQPQADGTYLVTESLRGLVRFRRHNLARDPIPPLGQSGFDLVACRNVLIYFEAPLSERVICSFERSLHPGGLLLLGPADALRRAASQPAVPAGSAADPAEDRQRGPGPPLGPGPALSRPAASREQRLTAALAAADQDDRDGALAQVASLLVESPLDADVHFVHGLLTLAAGDPAAAADALRRALCADAVFAIAAFALGRAYDALGDEPAALRAYAQALRTLDPQDDRHEHMLQQVDIGDIAVACRARLAGSS